MKMTTDEIVRALRNAAFYEAREAELHYRAKLRAELQRYRRSKGRQRRVEPLNSRPRRSP